MWICRAVLGGHVGRNDAQLCCGQMSTPIRAATINAARRTMKQILFLAALSLLEPRGAGADVSDKSGYSRDLHMVNVAWNACRFLGHLDEEAPSHDQLMEQTERDLARLFPGDDERFQAREQAWAGVKDTGLGVAERIREMEDLDAECRSAYLRLKATFQVTRDRLGLGGTPSPER